MTTAEAQIGKHEFAFTSMEAKAVIEDSLTGKGEYCAGVVAGLCGAFHMVGLLTEEEANSYLNRTKKND